MPLPTGLLVGVPEPVAPSVSSTSCLEYQVVGVCYWLRCPSFGCNIRTSAKVRHYVPDAVVSSYPSTGENPKREGQTFLGSTGPQIRFSRLCIAFYETEFPLMTRMSVFHPSSAAPWMILHTALSSPLTFAAPPSFSSSGSVIDQVRCSLCVAFLWFVFSMLFQLQHKGAPICWAR